MRGGSIHPQSQTPNFFRPTTEKTGPNKKQQQQKSQKDPKQGQNSYASSPIVAIEQVSLLNV